MSAKWRALQHRHRYTYSAVVFPQDFIEALDQTPSSRFFSELKQLVSLTSTYAQLIHAKNLASAFSDLLSNSNSDEGSIALASRLYLEILFLENSLPLHRALVSVLSKCKNFQTLIRNCFRELCQEYGGVDGKGKRFCVSRAALSMMSTPKLGYLVEIVEECAVSVGLDVLSGLNYVVSETSEWSRPSPLVMEQCQEALSCLYYLLQRFPAKFVDADVSQGLLVCEKSSLLETIVTTVMSILNSESFSRDCFVAAGVSFCAALQVCLCPEELGSFIMDGIFNQIPISCTKFELKDVTKTIPWKEKLVSEIQKLAALSRLCLIRGILTAVSRTVLNILFVVSNDGYDGMGNPGNSDSSVKTILYDGILPELCNFCENPTDSHFNFHALTVMQICLQQIKTSMQGSDGYIEEGYDPISEEVGTRVLKIVWNNLEDPLSQTVKQVHLIFDLFLDIQVTLHWAEGSEKFYSFLRKIASDLLHLGPRCKGRYIPLASLTKRLGAKSILDMSPGLLFDTTKAYVDDDVCCAATTFLKCFLECLRDEYWSTDGVEGGFIKYRTHCLLPVLSGLSSGFAKLRSNLNTYALPVLLELDVDSIFPMLGFIGIGCSAESTEVFYPGLDSRDIVLGVEQRVAVLVSLLKVSRMLALIEGDIDWCEYSSVAQEVRDLSTDAGVCDSVVHLKGIEVKIPVNYLVLALTHIDDSLRIDAAESLFINPKTASLPSSLELSLMRKAVPLNMRCCSTAFQMKWASLFRKFFSRVRTALERLIKQGNWQPTGSKCLSGSPLNGEVDQTLKHRADDLFNFMKWLSCFLFLSCYPSAPYERKIMAMELMLIMLNVWHIMPPPQEKSDSHSSEISLYPYSKVLILPESTLLLVGSIVDSWDRLRESSFRILLHFPTPLPGISSPELVREAIIWAKKLVCSPRVRESDAGALTFRLIFRKYVLELGWVVRASCNVVTQSPSGLPNGENLEFTSSSPVIEYISSLIDWLSAAVEEGEKDLSEACKSSFVHGVLLTLRYTFEEMDWDSIAVASNISNIKLLLEKILALVMRITSLALWVVSADAWCLPDENHEMEEMMVDGACFLERPIEMDVSASIPVDEMKIAKAEQDDGPMDQIVMVGCWLAMKEVSLLLGTIIRKVPLPTSDVPKACFPITDDQLSSDIVLDLRQLEIIGNHFLEVLLKMKHNGAIDKTRAGFTALCNRLLCSNDPRLCKLTESWMEQLMERTVAKGQSVDDLLRRSAGIPAAFTAFFLSEPEGVPKRLLPKALRWLINVANKSLTYQNKEHSSHSESSSAIDSTMVPNVTVIEKISKTRDEGVVPTVHAFNILRAAFNDANLATDTSGFSAEALIVSIRSFSSSYWEVRNSACLAYTALVRRMIGFLNVQKRESARRALTGLEFFHRYPILHPFLFNELKIATELFLERSSENLTSNLAKVVHPSLCPMLILLSRLKPSPITSETGDPLDPFLFMPFIRKCSVQNNLRIRVLASRALTGMVSNEKLPIVILNIASELPAIDNKSMTSDLSGLSNLNASFNSIHGMLLQLSSLLDVNCRNLADFSKREDILNDLIHVLGKHSWIGSPQKCPCPILNSSFLKVLDNMLSIARTSKMSKCISLIWNLLWTLSSECLDLYTSNGPAYFDPTIAELRKQAASSYFNCAYQTSKDVNEEDLIYLRGPPPDSELFKKSKTQMSVTRFQERLIRSLTDALYEVRIATLKWLLLFLNSPESGTESSNKSHSEIKMLWLRNIGLQATLMQLLAVEKNHKCMNYILKIIYTYNLQEYNKNCRQHEKPRFVGNMDSDSVLQFWDKVVSLYKVTRHAKTREMLVCCMAVCIKQLADLFTSSICGLGNKKVAVFNPSDPSKLSVFSECIDYFVKVIQEHSDASEPINMRKAAAQSIVASGLLEQAQALSPSVFNFQVPDGNKHKEALHLYGHKILDLWFTCIKLLEDEDVGLRKQLSLEVQKCITSGKSGSSISSGVVPIQVEKVIEMSFEHLSSTFGHWLDYLEFLCHWVLSATNYVGVVSREDPVRRVFDKEIDNHHEEKLLISQICCSHLEKLPVLKLSTELCGNNICSLLQSWRRRFCQELISFSSDYIGRKGVEWIGGVGNHRDAFLPVYVNLLGFHALSNCILSLSGDSEDSKSILPELLELGEAIQPFLRNTLISNLFVLVVKSHEKIGGGAVDHLLLEITGPHSAWDAFDPYFLFR